jgi:hypothetical protein
MPDVDNQQLSPLATLLAAKDTEFNVQLEPGKTSAGRFVFALQNAQNPSRHSVQFGDSGGSRPVSFDLSSLK